MMLSSSRPSNCWMSCNQALFYEAAVGDAAKNFALETAEEPGVHVRERALHPVVGFVA